MSESKSQTTHKHEEIRRWAEERGGIPAKVASSGHGDGVLRIHFPDNSQQDKQFEEISWEEFFKIFDKNELDFLYQDKKKSGETSTFHKFVARN
ncbi:MAG: hypothetical protein HC880_13265 [Bacteroidia bacterium]|nr:hypothetical protein [Bacteroidia bacterium]